MKVTNKICRLKHVNINVKIATNCKYCYERIVKIFFFLAQGTTLGDMFLAFRSDLNILISFALRHFLDEKMKYLVREKNKQKDKKLYLILQIVFSDVLLKKNIIEFADFTCTFKPRSISLYIFIKLLR